MSTATSIGRACLVVLAALSCSAQPPGVWNPIPKAPTGREGATRLDEAGSTEPKGYDARGDLLAYWHDDGAWVVDVPHLKRLKLDTPGNVVEAAVDEAAVVVLMSTSRNGEPPRFVLLRYDVASGDRTLHPLQRGPVLLKDLAACRGMAFWGARTGVEDDFSALQAVFSGGGASVGKAKIEFGKGLSCEGDWLISDTGDGFPMMRLSTGAVSRFNVGTKSDTRRPRTDGRYLVWEDLRDDAKGVLNLLGYDSNIYSALPPDGQPSPVTTDPAIQASPDVGSDWVVWKDFRNSATPNFIGAKDQVDIFGKRIGAARDVRLTFSPGVSFDPRVEGGKLFFRRRLDGDPGAGIFEMSLP